MQKMILFIDDDHDDIEAFRQALHETNLPYYCISMNTAENALLFLENSLTDPEFIFVDIHMPGINGKEFLKRLKANPKYKHIPTIIYSTTKQKKEIEEVYGLGADYFVTKPATFELTVHVVTRILTDNWEKIVA
jgi:CheY-like chemotaxis protein